MNREQIIAAAKLKDADIGDNAIIAESECGFWIGTSTYVSKTEVENIKIKRKAER